MKRLLAFAFAVGLASVLGAQQKSAGTHSAIAPSHDLSKAWSPPVVSSTTNGRSTTIVLDISGMQSWDYLGDPSNSWIYVPIPVGDNMIGIGWDVNLATIGASYLSEAAFHFDGSDQVDPGLYLTPGSADNFPGTGYYYSPVIDLTDNGIPDIPILADGLLWIELFEWYDDVNDAADADWVAPSTLTIVHETPVVPPPKYPYWIEDFDGGVWPPAGWTTIDNTGNGDWNTNTFYFDSNTTGGTGECACIDSDYIGSVDIDCELISPAFDIPPIGTTLEFDMDYQNYALIDYADVDIDVGGGWVNLVSYHADNGPNVHVALDLSAYAGATGAKVRFHYYLANWAWWWEVDNVALYPTASATFRNAGTNPASYTDGPPIMGTDFTATIDLTTTGHTMAWLVGYSGPTTYTLPGGQTVLVDTTSSPELLQLPPAVGPIATYTYAVPNDPAFLGIQASTQAVHFGGVVPFALSNAIDVVLGY
ncbi:MAG: choice-of-anchor J domain-containing protein [Planctomycetota bacterium]